MIAFYENWNKDLHLGHDINSALGERVLFLKIEDTNFGNTKDMLLKYIGRVPTGTSVLEIIGSATYQRNTILINKASNMYFSFIGTSYYNGYTQGIMYGKYGNGTWNTN